MNLDDPEDRDAAAAEFVTGSLDAVDREAFERALAHDAALEAIVYGWQDRLVDLVDRVAPRIPEPALWDRIERRLGAYVGPVTGRRPAANDSLWERLATWRAISGLAVAASLVLAVFVASRSPEAPAPRFVAVLQSPTDRSTGWFVEGTATEGVRLVPVGGPAGAPAGRTLQFWTKPVGASGPTSLGLVAADRTATVPIARLPGLADQQLFEVTLEPEGGSPIGKPTGPVLYVGRTAHL